MAEENAKDEAAGSQEFDVDSIAAFDKVAILLLSLTEEDAAQILRHLEPKQVQKVGMAMAGMQDFSQDKISAVHNLFLDDIQKYSSIGLDSEEFVRNALTQALGEDKAGNLIDQIIMGGGAKGLDSLKWMDARQVANIILNEHPQIQTIVLSYLEPEQSAEILNQFPEKVRLDLTMRIANLEEVQPAALQELNEIMEKQFAGQSGAQAAKMGGLKAAANIMNYLDTNIEGQLMDSIRENDEEMAQQIQDLMFVFENLVDVDDRGIQALLREVPQEQLLKALKGADDTLKNKVYDNMSKRAAEMLKDDLEAMGPVRISEVEAAQKEILSIARRLADSGEIMLGGAGGGEEFL
ncbi:MULTISPECIES: flagellar motor switch protein FliG [Corallincola]|uniref:Flagellar motor switch protein FliG n=3 Tax=Corallincola TaxID=1775176 RepID=A0A368N322_9GAMM|nr:MULTISPECIES: flagellar motor switch protein FliG [Corallincola]RCU44570.1 flagellar motor switch protein FliG [Corallincola holothuriorum]TAA40315.1 flagellar motor switch protein FliG [Corallincola spongiicola]TCI05378.1 flagellar motor switch protein FliG [Corallincola luteus]